MYSVALYTLGCKLNFSETSAIGRSLQDEGFQVVPFQQSADYYVVNTCSVTEHADRKCKKIVREAKKLNPNAKVAIIGCYAQLKPDEIVAIKGVDMVLGASEKFNLAKHLLKINDSPTIFNSHIKEVKEFNNAYSIGDRTRTFLKVQDGCNYFCSFCTIPLARGRSRSNTIDNVIASAKDIANQDVKEIVLTGVNIGDFGYPNDENLLDLVKALEDVGVNRIRISSIEPNLLSDDIIEQVSNSRCFVPHFHVPLQSGSDKILKLMRRRYERKLYRHRVAKIKDLMPNACIGVDVIVGFPGETDEDFLETYKFLNELDISYLHVFSYSERANTTAVRMEGRVSNSKRTERRKMLQILSDKKKRAFYQQFVQQTHQVLFEDKIVDGFIYGHTANYLQVKVPYDPIYLNELVPVYLKNIDVDGVFKGTVVEEFAVAK